MTEHLSTNPYDVLGVAPGASKTEITKAYAMAMKKKQYPLSVIAAAQKSLLNPEERIIADYLRPYLPPIHRFKNSDFKELELPEPQLEILSNFDEFDENILNKELVDKFFNRSPVEIVNSSSSGSTSNRYIVTNIKDSQESSRNTSNIPPIKTPETQKKKLE